MTFKPVKPVPDNIIEQFNLICEGAQKSNGLAVVRVNTSNYPYEQYIVGVVRDGTIMPLAIIPSNMSVMSFLEGYDTMMGICGGPQMDPDYKGVRQ